MLKDDIEEAIKLFESSRTRLEKSKKEGRSKGDANEVLDKTKTRGKMRRIVVNIIKKQIERMNDDIDKGNLIAAEARRILIEKLIPNIKPKA